MSQLTQAVDENTFEAEVLNAATPVLVDFWAEWCGPCRMIAPIIDEVAQSYADKVKVTKVNVDESPALAAKYGIRGIPTLLLFKNGNVEGTKFGAVSKNELTSFLDDHL